MARVKGRIGAPTPGYRDRNACYVLTAIRGAVVTFQLSAEGEKRLAAAGIGPGEQFPRALLLDLYRMGDTYTGGNGTSDITLNSAGQLGMDSPMTPIPTRPFPRAILWQRQRLHLTISGKPQDLIAQLQDSTCRAPPGTRPVQLCQSVCCRARFSPGYFN